MITCRFCKAELPHFVALLDHYKVAHPDKVKRYDLRNVLNKQKAYIDATNEDEACAFWGWDRKYCHVREIG